MAGPEPNAGMHAPRRRPWLWLVPGGCALALGLALALETVRVLTGSNFHVVVAGRVYRCSQPSPGHLERWVRAYGVRTVLNLRGCCAPHPWYLEECRVTQRLDVAQEDICFSAGRLPATGELRRLIEVLDHCEYPVLFHCQRGADRTGMTAAIVLLLLTDAPLASARGQLGLRYGHVPLGRPSELDRFLDLYAAWLRARGLRHAPAVFRRWCLDEYCPGPCRGALAVLDPPASVPCGRPFALRVYCRNTSAEPWRLSPAPTAGIHLSVVLHDDQYHCLGTGRAGLFEALVLPGGSIELTVALPVLPRPGRYHVLLDMIDEQHCCFYQTGSEPLEQELDAREEDTAARVQPGDPGRAGVADRLAPGR